MGAQVTCQGAVQVKVDGGQVQSWCSVPIPHRTTQWSRRPIASAPPSLQLSGAAHRQRSAYSSPDCGWRPLALVLMH